jgi:hypothetical protein
MRLQHIVSSIVLTAGLVTMSTQARAEEPEELRELGYGHPGNNRLTLSASLMSGQRRGLDAVPVIPVDPAAPVPSTVTKEDYSRSAAWLSYEYYTYFSKTRFDTLVGMEFLGAVGFITPEVADPERKPEPHENWTKVHAQMDVAIDYALVHWGGGLPGRVVFGAGGGGEIGSYWHNEDAMAYPLLLGRVQLFPSQSLGVHLAYKWIPTTTGDYTVSDHRTEAAVALGSWQLGARFALTNVDFAGQTLSTSSLGLMGAYVF